MSTWFRRNNRWGHIHVMSATDPWTICIILVVMLAIILAVVLY